VRDLVRRANGDTPRMVRVTVYAPELELARPGADQEPHVLVTTRPASTHRQPPLRLRSVTHRRDLPGAKHAGLFETIRRRRIAQRAGFDDALFVDEHSRILEGATWNVGFHDGTRLIWPDGDQLPGVTQALITAPSATREVDLTAAAGYPVAFATNAAFGVRPIKSIDDIPYAVTAGVLDELSRRYLALPGDDV
jgi:branched-subunit amino acid aminotransferase/4-amino-4-deoxychorismate lyase